MDTENQVDEMDGDEFCERTTRLQISISETCDKEEHAGVTVYALVHALATNAHNLAMANGEDIDLVAQQVHTDLDELFELLKSGAYYQNNNYLN